MCLWGWGEGWWGLEVGAYTPQTQSSGFVILVKRYKGKQMAAAAPHKHPL